MSSGAYDGLHPSSSYGHGDSWRPSGSNSLTYERRNYHSRRRSPSPARRYVPNEAYFPYENNYRPNNYRPDEESTYYSRSPSPDHYSRTHTRPPGPDRWGRPASWANDSALWEQSSVVPSSPTTPAAKGRRDSMLATRMFEPSDSWKQNHVDRPLRIDTTRSVSMNRHPHDSPLPRTSLSPSTSMAGNTYSPATWGDVYRPLSAYRDGRDLNPRADSYRPGWSPSSPVLRDTRRWAPNTGSKGENYRPNHRSSSRYDGSIRRVSDSISLVGSGSPHRSPNRNSLLRGRRSQSRSHRSSSRSRRSNTRSLSRDLQTQNDHRSISRGRRSLSRERSSVSKDVSPSSQKHFSPVKQNWDRSASGVSPTAQTFDSPPRKISWTRASSRSSIASSRPSIRSPSPIAPIAQPQLADPAILNAEDTELQKEVVSDSVEMESTSLAHTVHVSKTSAMSENDNKSLNHAEASPHSPGSASRDLTSTVGRVDDLTVSPPRLLSMSPAPTGSSSNGTLGAAASTDLKMFDMVNGAPGSPSPGAGTSHAAGLESQGEHDSLDQASGSLTNTEISTQSTKHQATQITRSPTHSTDGVTTNIDKSQSNEEKNRKTSPCLPDHRTSNITDLPLPASPSPSQPPLPHDSHPILPPPDGIPTEAKTFREALRIVVMTRVLCDRQPREERINPVLLSNLAIADQLPADRLSTSSDEVIKDALEGPRYRTTLETYTSTKTPFHDHFKKRQEQLKGKVQRLQDEYLTLHERWLVHCALLDEQSKPATVETDLVQPSGRTTRRSAAGLGDAVRSDLEMEQIIASLGNDDATDPNHLSLRNLATVPDMLSVTCSKVGYYFDDTNHFVHNASEYYGSQTGIHDWTEWEKEVFLDKFAAHPKQFGLIAEHLPNKTAAQCVDYYYLHKKKFIDFRKVVSQYAPNKRKRRGTGKKRGNGLLADIRQHDAEVHGEADSSKSSARPNRNRRTMAPPELKEPKRAAPSRRRNQLDLTPSGGSATPTPEPETRRRARRSAMTSSRTVSVSLEEAEQEVEELERPAKRAKRSRKVVKSAAIVTEVSPVPEVKFADTTEPISRRKSGTALNHWSDEDKKLFLTLLSQHGDDFKRIAASMPNKTTIQVTNYFKANIDELEKVAAMAPKRSPTPHAKDSRSNGTSSFPPQPPETTNNIAASDLLSPPTPNSHQASTNGVSNRHHERRGFPASPFTSSRRNPREPTDPGLMAHRSPDRTQGHVWPSPYARQSIPATYAPPRPPHPQPPSSSISGFGISPYPTSRYSQFEPAITPQPQSLRLHRLYSIQDPSPSSSRRLLPSISIRARENPYPVVPQPAYRYSLERS